MINGEILVSSFCPITLWNPVLHLETNIKYNVLYENKWRWMRSCFLIWKSTFFTNIQCSFISRCNAFLNSMMLYLISGIGSSASREKGGKRSCFLEWAAGTETEEIMSGGLVYQQKPIYFLVMTETHILNYLSAGSAMDSFCFVLFRFKFLFSSFILYDLPNYQFLQLSMGKGLLEQAYFYCLWFTSWMRFAR